MTLSNIVFNIHIMFCSNSRQNSSYTAESTSTSLRVISELLTGHTINVGATLWRQALVIVIVIIFQHIQRRYMSRVQRRLKVGLRGSSDIRIRDLLLQLVGRQLSN